MANVGIYNMTDLWTDGGTTYTAIKMNVSDVASATGSNLADLQVGSTSYFTVTKAGNVAFPGTLTINSTTAVDGVIDDDTMGTASATKLATSESIKAYVDAQVTAADLDFAGDGPTTGAVDLDSQTFTIQGTINEIVTTATGATLTIALGTEIAVSKLANGTARQLLQTDATGTGVEWASNIDVPGTLDVTGIATFDNDVVFNAAIDEKVYNVTGTVLDPGNGTVQYVTLSGNTTYTETFAEGESMVIMIDDGTAYTVTWPTMTWVNNAGVAPTLATTGYTVVALWKVSTTLYGALVGDGS